MPYDISHPFIYRINREWKKATNAHTSYVIKNKFHQERRTSDWTNELRNIDNEFRKRIENAEKDLEREETEQYVMQQEESQMRKLIAREKRKKRNAENETKTSAVPTRISRRNMISNWK